MHTSCYFSANCQLNEAQNFDKIRHKCYENTKLVRQSINIAVYNKIRVPTLDNISRFLPKYENHCEEWNKVSGPDEQYECEVSIDNTRLASIDAIVFVTRLAFSNVIFKK